MQSISPAPTAEEAAAIAAAVIELWPRATPAPVTRLDTSWRFSGRWWRDETPLRRARP